MEQVAVAAEACTPGPAVIRSTFLARGGQRGGSTPRQHQAAPHPGTGNGARRTTHHRVQIHDGEGGFGALHILHQRILAIAAAAGPQGSGRPGPGWKPPSRAADRVYAAGPPPCHLFRVWPAQYPTATDVPTGMVTHRRMQSARSAREMRRPPPTLRLSGAVRAGVRPVGEPRWTHDRPGQTAGPHHVLGAAHVRTSAAAPRPGPV